MLDYIIMDLFPKWAKNLIFLLVYIFSGAALLLIVDGLSTGSELTPFNTTIETAILHIRFPALTHFMVTITNLGSPFILFIVSFFLIVVLGIYNRIYDALLFIFAMLLTVFGYLVLQNIFQLSRPDAVIVGIAGWSFPSGHAAVATTFFLVAAHSFIRRIKSGWGRLILVVISTIGAVLISFSRLYLGPHWSLDILAGIALGLASVSFTVLLFNIFIEEEEWRMVRRHRKS